MAAIRNSKRAWTPCRRAAFLAWKLYVLAFVVFWPVGCVAGCRLLCLLCGLQLVMTSDTYPSHIHTRAHTLRHPYCDSIKSLHSLPSPRRALQAATVMGIIVPIAVMLLAAICVPYVLTRGLLPLCGVPDWASEHLFRFSYPSLVIGGVAWVAVGVVQHRLAEIHNRIRDEKYMIGTTLANAPPHVAAAGGAQGPDADHASEANEPDDGNDAGAGVAPPLAGAATS